MTNEGNKLTRDILESYGYVLEIEDMGNREELKTWYKDGITIHEESWWIYKGKSSYSPDEILAGNKEPEITFGFATRVRGSGEFKSGFSITTDRQLENLHFSLTDKKLERQKHENII